MAGSFIDVATLDLASSPTDVHQVLRGFESLWTRPTVGRRIGARAHPVALERRLDAPMALAEIRDRLIDRCIVEPASRVIEIGVKLPGLAERMAGGGDRAARTRLSAADGPRVGAGCVLGQTAARSVDVVVSVDCFPLLNQLGDGLPARAIGEVARVLRPGGHLVIVGFSDRGDTARDRFDLVEASVAHGLVVIEMAESPLAESDAAWFHLRRPMR